MAGGNEFDAAVATVAARVVHRLGLPQADATALAQCFLGAVLTQAVTNVESQSLGPSTIGASRQQLVECFAARLGRVPSVREVAALLRVTDTVAQSILRNVLAISDRASDLALSSVFTRAKREGTVGRKGDPPGGVIWRFASKADLQQARELLERRGVKFSTREEADGDYILVVDASFDPLAGS